jgi:hypothetical protein
MRIRTSFFALFAALFCGCHNVHFKACHGDIAQFIVQQAAVRGRQPAATNQLPVISCSWSYCEDKYGVIIRLPLDDYDAVEGLLHQAFGEPAFGPHDTKTGARIGVYRPTPSTGSIQFLRDSAGAQVIILRHLTENEVSEALKNAPR